jgi:large subunit ribosomal protein L10
MENPRAEKVAVVAEVREKLSSSEAAVVTEYRGLNVAASSDLRRALKAAGGDYKIYKNTLVRFAARDLGLEIDDLLTGPTAIAFIDGDAAAVAKVLRDYARTNPALVVKGGLLGTRVIGAGDVNALAELPSRDQLLSEIAGLFAAPMQQFASLLEAVPRTFAYGIQALIDKGGNPGVAEPEPEAVEAEPEPEAVEAEPEPEAVEAEPEVAETAPDTTEAPDTTDTPDDATATDADATPEES